jgi:hypothetical protein
LTLRSSNLYRKDNCKQSGWCLHARNGAIFDISSRRLLTRPYCWRNFADLTWSWSLLWKTLKIMPWHLTLCGVVPWFWTV